MMNQMLTFFAELTSIESVIKWISFGVIALLLVIMLLLMGSNRKNYFNTKSIVFAAICIAASFSLSFIRVSMTFGGSITFASMIPLFIYAYAFGPVKGLLAGIVYGLLQFIQAPYFLNVLQFALDYILPFASIAFAGVMRKVLKDKPSSIFIGLGLFSLARLIMHVGSGIIFYNMGWIVDLPLFGAGSAYPALIYSLLYNMLYLVPETIINFAVLAVLVYSKSFYTMLNMVKSSTSEAKNA